MNARRRKKRAKQRRARQWEAIRKSGAVYSAHCPLVITDGFGQHPPIPSSIREAIEPLPEVDDEDAHRSDALAGFNRTLTEMIDVKPFTREDFEDVIRQINENHGCQDDTRYLEGLAARERAQLKALMTPGGMMVAMHEWEQDHNRLVSPKKDPE
jgi:hypothetical protein